MDRKKTILIAILINAGLLALLFIMALYREEDDAKSVDVSHHILATQEKPPSPLFNDPGPIVEVSPAPSFTPPLAMDPIIHQLPPLVSEMPQPPLVQTPLSPSLLSKIIEVTVKKGDTMEKIAKAHHTTVDEILRINQLPSTFLRIGQVLKLPNELGLTHLPAMPKPSPNNNMSNEATNLEYYIVKVGDNPTRIAEKHRMKVEELLKLNQLNEEKARKLKPGDRLRVK